jgi:hypothetical protein
MAVLVGCSTGRVLTMRRSTHATLNQVLPFQDLVDIQQVVLGRKMTKRGRHKRSQKCPGSPPPRCPGRFA